MVSDVAALPAAQPEPLGAARRYGCRCGLRPWQFSLTCQSDVNAAPSDETSRPARRVSPGRRFKDGLRPRTAALWRPLYGESADVGHRQRSFCNADSRMPRVSLRGTEQRSGHGPQVEVAKQTHSHTPAHDGDAEIAQDLFLTKWSSIPGEFEAPLAPTVDFGADHLLRFKTYLGSKRRAHQS